MTPRETVFEQVRHHETPTVPYTLAFEPEVAERLDEHYAARSGGRTNCLP